MNSAYLAFGPVIAVLFLFYPGQDSVADCDNPVSDLRLNGTWEVVGLTFGMFEENTIPIEGDLKGFTVVVLDGKGRFLKDGQKDIVPFRFAVNTTKTPLEMDVLDVSDGIDKKRFPLKCIYAVEKDSLKVRFHVGLARIIPAPFFSPDAPRPTGFGKAEWASYTFLLKRIPT